MDEEAQPLVVLVLVALEVLVVLLLLLVHVYPGAWVSFKLRGYPGTRVPCPGMALQRPEEKIKDKQDKGRGPYNSCPWERDLTKTEMEVWI
eukprot:3353160-Rhodomonas_salina.1